MHLMRQQRQVLSSSFALETTALTQVLRDFISKLGSQASFLFSFLHPTYWLG
jgi:hypothetical protein